MRKLLTLTLLLILTPACLRAQKKEISQARTYIKSGKDYDKAAKLMKELIEKDSASSRNTKAYETWFEAVKLQYEAGNQKLYLKEKYDTATLYSLTKTMYEILCSLDSVEVLLLGEQQKKGEPRSRKKSAETLDKYRPNLYHGGTHLYKKADYAGAFGYFDAYLAAAGEPMFKAYDYAAKDKKMNDAAFWATACGHRLSDPDRTLRYAPMAEGDTARLRLTLRFEADAYKGREDQEKYVETLRRGMRLYPKYEYFFLRLMDHYTDHNQPDSALNVGNEALNLVPDYGLFLYAKSTVLLNMGRNDECIEVTRRLIEQGDTVAEPYFNIATAMLNQIVVLEGKPQRDKEAIKTRYEEAMPYMERYRDLAPDQKKKWAPALYRIYLNLNLGPQFEEIDKLMSEM